ncbi:hypothetical protein LIER_17487 [Lithospermum erythrorhizon]|uniref:Uncharacterized protein n=1 Tax=Lithospermum erythrorhizon TaxID=34254 RepID=A0AAV3QCV5_LITER
MAYRRRQGITRASTFQEKIHPHPPLHEDDDEEDDLRRPRDVDMHSHSFSSSSSSASLAAQAVKATASRRDSPFFSASGGSSFHSSLNNHPSKEVYAMRNSNEADGSGNFWSVLAKKAKSLLDDEPFEDSEQTTQISTNTLEYFPPYQQTNSPKKVENPALRKKFDALTSSLNHIGDQIGKSFEEGRTIVEIKTAGIIQETKKLQIRRQPINFGDENHVNGLPSPWKTFNKSTQQPMIYSHEDRLKASRDVALATAAKAKVLLRELKTVKADLAFAKERCSQLEDENKVLRDACEKGSNPEDDDMIRLQMETLLAEKARLAHENSVYARENRFLREIVEYHQLTMQDVVYLDEGIEEVTEVYPIHGVSGVLSSSPPSPSSPPLSLSRSSSLSQIEQDDNKDYPQNKTPRSSKSSPPPTQFSNRC